MKALRRIAIDFLQVTIFGLFLLGSSLGMIWYGLYLLGFRT